MEDWLEAYARALGARLQDAGIAAMSPGEIEGMLDLARDVAHGTERKLAPLSTYLAGRYVQARVATGIDPAVAAAEASSIAASLLGGAAE